MTDSKKCEKCEESGIVFTEEYGVSYCSCPEGVKKEYQDNSFIPKAVDVFA